MVSTVMRNLKRGVVAVAAFRIAIVAAAYYGAGQVGLLLALVRGQVSPMWPSTGIALVCLLVWGLRVWPGVTLGAFLINISLGPSIPVVMLIAVGNTLAPVCACLLLRGVGFGIDLHRLRDALALVFLGAFTGTLVSATGGSVTLVGSGALPASQFWSTWGVWWAGDAMGVLVVAPLLLAARAARVPRGVRAHRWAEAATLLVSILVVAALATRISVLHYPLFLVFPFLIWAALRFQLLGAAACVLVVSTMAILAAADGVGAFAGLDLLTKMVTLHAFNGSVAMTGLLLAAIITERNHALRAVEQTCVQLADTLAKFPTETTLLETLLPESVRQARTRAGDDR